MRFSQRNKHFERAQVVNTGAQTERFFLPKQLLLFTGIFIAVLFLDVILFLVFAFIENQNTSNAYSGEQALTTISENMHTNADGSYSLSLDEENSTALYNAISENKWGAVYLDSTGDVVWSYNAPDVVPSHFSQNDIAMLSYYRAWDIYSTLIWMDDAGGLTILFRPSNVYGGITLFVPYETSSHIPFYMMLMLFVDAFIFFLFYLFSRRSIAKFINPALVALDNLAQGRPTRVSFSGTLRTIGNKINRVSDTLIKKETARKNWVEGVSHDVRTPLAVIMGHSETIKLTTENPAIKNSAETITQQSIRIRDLVEDLNIATQLEYDMQPLKNSTIIISRLLREFVADNLNQMVNNTHTIELSISPDANQISLQGDEKLLARALQNALNNAIKHNPNGCVIAIELTCTNVYFSIRIKDSGRGMDTTTLNQLKERLREESLFSQAGQNSLNNPICPEKHIQSYSGKNSSTKNINQQKVREQSNSFTKTATSPSHGWKNNHENPVISGQDYTPCAVISTPTEPVKKSSKDGSAIRQHGIGLSLINRIVITHGGVLEIESSPQCGFALTMIFPYEQ